MEIKSLFFNIKSEFSGLFSWLKEKFLTKSSISQKAEVNLLGFKWVFLASVTVFIGYVVLMPQEVPQEFSQKMADASSDAPNERLENSPKAQTNGASKLWGNSVTKIQSRHDGNQINYNTPMTVDSKFGNARTQFRAGLRIPLRIVDKFIVSKESVPILAESILDSTLESGIRIPAGTRFYGEANFEHGSERSSITFKQLSLPSGEIRPINAIGIGKDGQTGMPGKIYSDGIKNTTGQVITSFVGGLASGSMQTDIFGHSRGGLENGLLSAVAETAKSRAQDYGEKLKTQREWIEVNANTELDALLTETLNLTNGGNL